MRKIFVFNKHDRKRVFKLIPVVPKLEQLSELTVKEERNLLRQLFRKFGKESDGGTGNIFIEVGK